MVSFTPGYVTGSERYSKQTEGAADVFISPAERARSRCFTTAMQLLPKSVHEPCSRSLFPSGKRVLIEIELALVFALARLERRARSFRAITVREL